MKLKFVPILFLLSAFCLTGCNNTKEGENKVNQIHYSDEKLMNSSLINSAAVDATTQQSTSDEINYSYVGSIGLDNNVYDNGYIDSGLLVTRNDYGYLGFYSLSRGEYILKPQFVPNWLNYSVQSVSRIGFLLKIRYNDIYTIYDGLGNVLLSDSYDSFSFYDQPSTIIINDKLYLIIYSDYGETYYYSYADDGKATYTSSLPNSQTSDPVAPINNDTYTSPLFSHLFTEGWVSLAPFGKPDTKFVYNNEGYVSVFKNEKFQSSFFVDFSSNIPLAVIGDDFLFQKQYLLPENSTLYSFTDGYNKYALEHTFVSLKTGKKTIKNYNVLFSNEFELINNQNSNTSYYYATYQKITDKLVLGDRVSSLVDSNFVFHDDVSGLHLNSFVKYKYNNSKTVFYNTSTKILYDSDFKVITYLDRINPVYNSKINMFVGSINGLKGIVDLEGVTRLEFRYSSVYPDSYSNGKLFAVKNGKAYLANLNNNSDNDSLLGTDLQLLANNLFTFLDGEERVFYSIKSGTILRTHINNYSVIQNTFLNKRQSIAIRTTDYYSSSYYETIHLLLDDSLKLFTLSSSTTGREQRNDIYDGTSSDKAQIIYMGSNEVHMPKNNNDFYVKFVAPSKGKYTFSSSDCYETNYGNNVVSYDLEQNEERILTYHRNSYSSYRQLTNIEVYKDQGASTYLDYNFDDDSYNFFSGSYDTRYLKFTAPSTGHYQISLDDTSYTIYDAYYRTENGYWSSESCHQTGIDVSEGTEVLLTLTIPTDSLSDVVPVRVTRTGYADALEGSSYLMAHTLPVGNVGSTYFTYSNNAHYGYVVFNHKYSGYYTISLTFNHSVSFNYFIVDSNGGTYSSNYGSGTSFSYNFNSTEMDARLVLVLELSSSQSTGIVEGNIASYGKGYTYDNPYSTITYTGESSISIFNSTYRYRFYKFQPSDYYTYQYRFTYYSSSNYTSVYLILEDGSVLSVPNTYYSYNAAPTTVWLSSYQYVIILIRSTASSGSGYINISTEW